MSTFGTKIKLTIFGESHASAVGCVLEGLPAGERINLKALNAFLARRAPGRSDLSSQRKEADEPQFLSGLKDGVLTGAALSAIIANADVRSADYAKLKDLPRPGHADYPAFVKYNGFNDNRGGGEFSGRLTAPLCVAGGIVLQLLEKRGIHIGAHIAQIATVGDKIFDAANVSVSTLKRLNRMAFPTISGVSGKMMQETIMAARDEGDSVGGVVELAAVGVPAGVGGPLFDGLENRLSQALFAIPAVKGISFGDGFYASCVPGSVHNDEYCVGEDSEIRTATNHCGGILGGISTGMPIVLRVAFKPTPSIAKPQNTVRLSTMTQETLEIKGRHDPCIVPRAVPAVIATAALALYDALS